MVCKIKHKIDYFIIHKYNNCNYKDPLSLPFNKVDKESVVRNCEDSIRHDKRHSGSFVAITDYQLYMRSKTNQVSCRWSKTMVQFCVHIVVIDALQFYYNIYSILYSQLFHWISRFLWTTYVYNVNINCHWCILR